MPDSPPPDLATALGGLDDNITERERKKDRRIKSGEHEAVEINGRKAFFRLRSRWSLFIIIWISCLTTFNCLLTMFVGFGSFNFKDYQWFVTSVTMETFLQIVGMGYVAVKFLFSTSQDS
ncbi:hypothetical protein [Acetobacter pasteurianus]|uniref:hypothetical protein n=1 Tax=Acetobacter pasteurianus TaxID=438 RepID=UPI001363F5F1|nr:hypothetical protein [Acetobacter pasteurianus]QHM91973.1 hypothetical protein FCN51_10675 [Acetobacter pasteurianus]